MTLVPLHLPTPAFSSGVRMVQVRGDNMEPGLRRERDWVVMLPCDDLQHEGLYVLDMDGRGAAVRRVQLWGKGEVGLISDNPAYGATPGARMQVVPRDYFRGICLGFVVGRLLIDELATLRDAGFEIGV
ncbi:S24 family peptidase [Aquabacter cavernae]|uniref:S24 family peptidase n=1 Tax=Aquabacter cavernae TaxID=2496029 RepID=UPI0013DF1117|nr:S24 family peptidase [Aquabacter cavernae]